jgi:hypothetical protein
MHRSESPGRRGRLAPLVAVVALSAALGGCFTGPRSALRPDLSSTGDAAIDAVLSRVEQVGAAVFTASYDADNAFAGTTTPVTVAQSAPDRRVTIIGDISYVVEGPRVRTCSDSPDHCEDVIDAARTSDVQLGPDFYATSATARLRTAAAAATGPANASSERIEDQAATCASIPLPDDTTVACVFDNGVLARLDASDVDLTMTSYSDEADESLWP